MTKTAVTNLVLLIKKKTWTDTVVHYLGRHTTLCSNLLRPRKDLIISGEDKCVINTYTWYINSINIKSIKIVFLKCGMYTQIHITEKRVFKNVCLNQGGRGVGSVTRRLLLGKFFHVHFGLHPASIWYPSIGVPIFHQLH